MSSTKAPDVDELASGVDVDAPVNAARVTAALDRARGLLGPAVVPPLDADQGSDEAVLEELVDVALTELRALVMSYSGPDALEVARAAYELADLARLMRLRSIERRVNGLTSVQRALAELRTVGSVELLLRRCTQVVCERCGFDRAVMYRVEGDSVFPTSAFDRKDRDWVAKVKHYAEKIKPPVLDEMLLETDMLRRRAPAIVHDAQRDPRTFKPWLELSDIRSYVAAPIAPEGRVIGFLHADVHYQRREVDIVDRDVLWAFAEGCGYALERTLLRDQVRQQRERIRELLRTADELVNDIGESELRIERADTEAAARTSNPLPAGGSRVHSLLTAREIEVMELLVHGATNKQIAERFVVTEGTVKAHVTHVYRKLKAANRAEAVHRYMRMLALDHQ
ncbi:MAG TPA: LuxR C-terminal-related transcriptional regulator [Solirubrobacteraceae bacterium]|nr:LuxR C-terminal-related transcriptional regulator [Solirubrobacteraceae bacterium]